MTKIRAMMIFLLFPAVGFGQNTWDESEISSVFDGIDVTAALERVAEKGITPYDFGCDLLDLGYPEKAKEWFVAVGIHTKDLKYVYGLAWTKWITGDNQGAIQDADYILKKDPAPIIRARTLYMLGAINVDEQDFKEAKKNLQAGLDAYAALNKAGGQYLCLSMMAMCSVFERKLDEVEPLLDRALEFNEKIRDKGLEPYGMGRTYEIRSELRFAKGDFNGALAAAQESEQAYRLTLQNGLADEVQARIALLLFMTGQPKAAKELASEIWESQHKSRDRARMLAYNAITQMKLSLCAQNEENAKENEKAARAWANGAPGGKALIKLLDWVKDEQNVPCPEWR